ncbi:unnamed protein product, partial [Laminaria digitata]
DLCVIYEVFVARGPPTHDDEERGGRHKKSTRKRSSLDKHGHSESPHWSVLAVRPQPAMKSKGSRRPRGEAIARELRSLRDEAQLEESGFRPQAHRHARHVPPPDEIQQQQQQQQQQQRTAGFSNQ